MLNLEHPRTSHIYAASQQIGIILDYAKRITFDNGNSRVFMAQIVAPCFAALRWLNQTRFDASPEIARRIDGLQSAIHELSELEAKQRDSPFERNACPVCNNPLTKPSRYDPVPYCPECLDRIIPSLTSLQSCEGGFGTEAI